MNYPEKNETEAKLKGTKSIRKFSDDIYGNKIQSSDKDNKSFDGTSNGVPKSYSYNKLNEAETDNNKIVLAIEEGIQHKIKANKLFKQNNYTESLRYYQKVLISITP
jgi:hypothetical protein